MPGKKPVFLLIMMICIGLAPLQTNSAGNMERMESMSLNCVDCDMDDGASKASCDDAQCVVLTGSCGSLPITGVAMQLFRITTQEACFISLLRSVESRYRSHLNFSIYRPPIA